MGNFYANYTPRGPSQRDVAKALARRKAVVAPAQKGCVVAFDEQSDEQDQKVIAALASRLSGKLRCPVLAVLNHDDDILWYRLYENGKLTDEYDSSPGYFDPEAEPSAPAGGDAQRLCAALGVSNAATVESVLRKSSYGEEGYAFASGRHADLVRALGLPECAVGTAYASFDSDECPEELSPEDVVRSTCPAAPSQASSVAREFDKRFKAILKQWITPTLSERGFAKQRGNVYERVNAGVNWYVDVQRGQWTTREMSDFTLNFGVYVPGYCALYGSFPEPSRITIPACIIQARIGDLAEDQRDRWWELHPEDDAASVDRAVGEDVSSRLKRHVLPFLERFQAPQDVLRFLEEPRPPEYKRVDPRVEARALCDAAVLAALLGLSEKSLELIERALVVGRKCPAPAREWHEEVRRRLQSRFHSR
jgi:hypothetical protein